MLDSHALDTFARSVMASDPDPDFVLSYFALYKVLPTVDDETPVALIARYFDMMGGGIAISLDLGECRTYTFCDSKEHSLEMLWKKRRDLFAEYAKLTGGDMSE